MRTRMSILLLRFGKKHVPVVEKRAWFPVIPFGTLALAEPSANTSFLWFPVGWVPLEQRSTAVCSAVYVVYVVSLCRLIN